MPRVTAGSFVSFAYERSARANATFVRRAVEQQRARFVEGRDVGALAVQVDSDVQHRVGLHPVLGG